MSNKHEEIFNMIIQKLSSRYKNLNSLRTTHRPLSTRIFQAKIYNYSFLNRTEQLSNGELPLLECHLPNQNYLLLTTERMISKYSRKRYEMRYDEYWWYDIPLFNKNFPSGYPVSINDTVVMKYYNLNRQEFWFEIDSREPFDAVWACIVYHLRNAPPPLKLLFPDIKGL